jgi:hypothetical protein
MARENVEVMRRVYAEFERGTTQIYADYAPSPQEAALVEAAFQSRGTNPGTNLSESKLT